MRSTALPPRPPPWTVAAGSGTCHPLLLAWSGLGTAASGGGGGAHGGGSPDSCRPGEAPSPPGFRVRVDLCVSVCSWLPPGALHLQQGAHAAGAPSGGGCLLRPVLHRHRLRQAGLLHHKGTQLGRLQCVLDSLSQRPAARHTPLPARGLS